MPNMDGTGPLGRGKMTGKGQGMCIVSYSVDSTKARKWQAKLKRMKKGFTLIEASTDKAPSFSRNQSWKRGVRDRREE